MPNSPNLTTLKRIIAARAHAELPRANPRYVTAFREGMEQSHGDIDQAIAAAEPFRANGMPKWSDLLTALFDMDLLALKVNEALGRLRSAHEARDFKSFHYHLDHWVFQFDAYLERSDKAFAKALRQLLKGSPHTGAILASMRLDFDQMRKAIGDLRNALAHGGGDGVSAITEYWLPFLAMDDPLPFDRIFLEATHHAWEVRTETRRTQLHLAVVDYCSAGAFARIEKLARTILDALPAEA